MAELSNTFLQKGISMVVDGTDAETIESTLNNDLDLMKYRHGNYSGVFKSWKDIASDGHDWHPLWPSGMLQT